MNASDALDALDALDDAFEPRGVGESRNWPSESRERKKERTGGEQRAHGFRSAEHAQNAQDERRGQNIEQNGRRTQNMYKQTQTPAEKTASAAAAEQRRKSLERQLQTQLAQLDRICAERLRPSPAVSTRRRQNSNFDDFRPQPSEAGVNCANTSDTVGDIGNFSFSGGPGSAQPENAKNTKLRQRTQ